MTYTGVNKAFANLYKNSSKGVNVNQGRNAVAKAAQAPKIDTSNPMGFLTSRADIKTLLDQATSDAFKIQRRQGLQDQARVENSLVGDRNATIVSMRKTLAGNVQNGTSDGAANATALQAALGLGMQQDNNLNAGLQNLQNLAAEEQAARSANGATAIDKANAAKGQQSTLAAEKYASDATYASTGLQALASLFWPGYDGSKSSGSSNSGSSSSGSSGTKTGTKVTTQSGTKSKSSKTAKAAKAAKAGAKAGGKAGAEATKAAKAAKAKKAAKEKAAKAKKAAKFKADMAKEAARVKAADKKRTAILTSAHNRGK